MHIFMHFTPRIEVREYRYAFRVRNRAMALMQLYDKPMAGKKESDGKCSVRSDPGDDPAKTGGNPSKDAPDNVPEWVHPATWLRSIDW